ncbi:uncharacterized protein HMPREF1541_11028 [Cyphellophora europaea CBS 101466]|uniref:Uncharacterized protein n=1 Tax=Cyphellophora europaea (strain CBS 101466) TaxID=1220924 RepID=W2S5F4_CYPE1|nr:uncharacterized protein HMPREF1541_11028 [Cyphellophora europaea CBS 101466]ETN43897.1 hypothetical protein HMPREF1541_11028 [Cyphellophora europaea CBS 101466]
MAQHHLHNRQQTLKSLRRVVKLCQDHELSVHDSVFSTGKPGRIFDWLMSLPSGDDAVEWIQFGIDAHLCGMQQQQQEELEQNMRELGFV